MIPQIDTDLRRWADWRASFTPGSGGYHYRSTLADIQQDQGAAWSASASLPSPRAWGIASRFDFGMVKLEHGVRCALTEHQRRAVLLRYTGYAVPDPCWKRQVLNDDAICSLLGVHRQTYRELLDRSHARLDRYLRSRTPLTSDVTPLQNPLTPARVG
jgi:hypothetical protein